MAGVNHRAGVGLMSIACLSDWDVGTQGDKNIQTVVQVGLPSRAGVLKELKRWVGLGC